MGHVKPPDLTPCPLYSEVYCASGERGGLMFIEHSFGPPDYQKPLQRVCLDEQSPGRQTCSQSPPFPRGLCKQPSQISLSPVFQSCSSQVPDHLTKSFASIDPYPWTYLAPKCIIKPTTQSSAPGRVPFTAVLRGHP